MKRRIKLLTVLILFVVSGHYLLAQNKGNCDCESWQTIIVKGKYGMIDTLGNIVIEPKYDDNFLFSEGMTVIGVMPSTENLDQTQYKRQGSHRIEKVGIKYGVLGCDGTVLFEPTNEFHIISPFVNGYAKAVQDNVGYFFNVKEKKFLKPGDAGYAYAYDLFYGRSDKWTALIKRMNSSLPKDKQMSYATTNTKGWRVVSKGGKSGFMDINGDIKINFKFYNANKFENGYALVKVDTTIGKFTYRQMGVIDTMGNYVVMPIYSELMPFVDGMSVFKKFNKEAGKGFIYGLLDYSGKELLTTSYELHQYSEGLILFRENMLYGYMNSKGEIVIKPKFSTASRFEYGVAEVGLKNGKEGYINKQGKYIWKPKWQN